MDKDNSDRNGKKDGSLQALNDIGNSIKKLDKILKFSSPKSFENLFPDVSYEQRLWANMARKELFGSSTYYRWPDMDTEVAEPSSEIPQRFWKELKAILNEKGVTELRALKTLIDEEIIHAEGDLRQEPKDLPLPKKISAKIWSAKQILKIKQRTINKFLASYAVKGDIKALIDEENEQLSRPPAKIEIYNEAKKLKDAGYSVDEMFKSICKWLLVDLEMTKKEVKEVYNISLKSAEQFDRNLRNNIPY
jgi:hypothetical protein